MLDRRQRRALPLFRDSHVITGGAVWYFTRNLLSAWVEHGFVVGVDPARKSRRYALGSGFVALFERALPSGL